MPSKSEQQRRAMRAAASGKSTLGIPKKVGQEFLAADRRKAKTQRRRAKSTVKKRRKRR
jgi:hypothetical protein